MPTQVSDAMMTEVLLRSVSAPAHAPLRLPFPSAQAARDARFVFYAFKKRLLGLSRKRTLNPAGQAALNAFEACRISLETDPEGRAELVFLPATAGSVGDAIAAGLEAIRRREAEESAARVAGVAGVQQGPVTAHGLAHGPHASQLPADSPAPAPQVPAGFPYPLRTGG